MSDLNTINRLIRNVATSTRNQNVRVQTVAVMCIEHAVEHGDANPAMRLVDALAPRLRSPLVAWFETYSRINVAKGAKGMTCSISKADARGWNLDGARVNPWYETAKAKADELPTTIEDLNDSVIRLADRMAKKLADGKVLEADRPAFEAKLAAVRAAA